VTENSVATTTEYIGLIDAVTSILLGLVLDGKKRRTEYFLQKKPGLFGHLTGCLGVHEVQARGALHLHLILFGGLKPELLQRIAGVSGLCDIVARALDKMYCASATREDHVFDLLCEELPACQRPKTVKVFPAIQCVRPIVAGEVERVAADYAFRIAQIHKHSFTCHKPPNGRCRCRMAKPDALTEQTGPCQIAADELGGAEAIRNIEEDNVAARQFGPLTKPDERMIVWEMKRPSIAPLDAIDGIAGTTETSQKQRILSELQRAIPSEKWFLVEDALNGMVISLL
jgi:hypothetical protein